MVVDIVGWLLIQERLMDPVDLKICVLDWFNV